MHRLRSLLNPIVDGIARVFVKLGFSPSGLTVIGVLVACVAAALIARGMLAAGGVVVLVAGVFDMFDGAVARMTNRATKFGALFDSVMDRVSEAVVLLGLLWFYLEDGEQLGAVLVYVSVVGSTMVSYVRARAEGLGIECKGGLMQRPERVASLGIGIIVGQWWEPAVLVVLGVIAVLTVVTTVQRVVEGGEGGGGVEGRQASMRRSPFGSGMGSPNSRAVSSHRSMALPMCARTASWVSPCSRASRKLGGFGHVGVVFVAPVDDDFVFVHWMWVSKGVNLLKDRLALSASARQRDAFPIMCFRCPCQQIPYLL